jgi:hypothetical protein
MSAPGKLVRSSRWESGPGKGQRPLGSECCVIPGNGGHEAYTAIAWGVGLSHERSDIAGAKGFHSLEGNTCGTAMRGADALPGSKATSRAKGSHRNLGGLRVARSLRRHTPEVGAVCGKAARTDLCGGARDETRVPTATATAVHRPARRSGDVAGVASSSLAVTHCAHLLGLVRDTSCPQCRSSRRRPHAPARRDYLPEPGPCLPNRGSGRRPQIGDTAGATSPSRNLLRPAHRTCGRPLNTVFLSRHRVSYHHQRGARAWT